MNIELGSSEDYSDLKCLSLFGLESYDMKDYSAKVKDTFHTKGVADYLIRMKKLKLDAYVRDKKIDSKFNGDSFDFDSPEEILWMYGSRALKRNISIISYKFACKSLGISYSTKSEDELSHTMDSIFRKAIKNIQECIYRLLEEYHLNR